MDRLDFLHKIVDKIQSIKLERPVIVGIDGIDCAGKTTFAEELKEIFEVRKHTTIRASIDGFHRPREERLAQGELSPKGYYEDSFDYPFLIENLLKPLKEFSPGLRIKTKKFDFRSNEEVGSEEIEIKANSLVLFEGVFLFRPELEKYWDYKIFVDIDFQTSLQRGLERDGKWMGGDSITERKYRERYIPGQQIYLKSVNPKFKADIVFNNVNPKQPNLEDTNS
ncbi:hypothetical protein ACFLRA_03750 [Bdellovibrionota bacterium]